MSEKESTPSSQANSESIVTRTWNDLTNYPTDYKDKFLEHHPSYYDKSTKPMSYVDHPPQASYPTNPYKQEMQFSFDENIYLKQITDYITQTYSQHYAQGKYQATDLIIDAGYGEGFCLGNIIKYCKRYGKKEGKNRADILKIIHYAIIQLYIHDHGQNGSNHGNK